MPAITAALKQLVIDVDVATSAPAAGDLLGFNAAATKWSNRPRSGATLPASPVAGELFMHTPTGRVILCQYDGSAWRPLYSYGAMTLYVSTTGTDDASHGTAGGSSAFFTVTYAVSWIPGQVGGDVTINVGAGTFAESVTLQGKAMTGPFAFSVQGTESIALATFTSASGTQGATSTSGSVVIAGTPWTPSAYRTLWLKAVSTANNAGVKRLVQDNTNNTITVVDYLAGAVVGTDTWQVVDAGTVINQFNVAAGQFGTVTIDTVAFAYGNSYYLVAGNGSTVVWRYCRQVCSSSGGGIAGASGTSLTFTSCWFTLVSLVAGLAAAISVNGCYLLNDRVANGATILSSNSSVVTLNVRNIIDGTGAGNSNYGVQATNGGLVNLQLIYHLVENYGGTSAVGLRANNTGIMYNSANVQYAGNTANSSADATTYGIIT